MAGRPTEQIGQRGPEPREEGRRRSEWRGGALGEASATPPERDGQGGVTGQKPGSHRVREGTPVDTVGLAIAQGVAVNAGEVHSQKGATQLGKGHHQIPRRTQKVHSRGGI